jgi:hypothetical protein
MPHTPPLPNFIIVGAQKSATRWLRTNLGEHPDVYIVDREVAFFSNAKRFRELGLDWYREQFGGWSGESHVGEGTPAYMMWRHHPDQVAGRIDESLPDSRVMAILRNPIDRAESALVHHIQRERVRPDANLLQLVEQTDPARDPLGLVAGGWYARSLTPYHERFGDRLLVLIHDDLAVDPKGVYRAAADHIDLSDDFLPPDLERVVFSNRADAPPSGTAPTEDERRALWAYFRDDVRELEQMIDRDLSQWDPDA